MPAFLEIRLGRRQGGIPLLPGAGATRDAVNHRQQIGAKNFAQPSQTGLLGYRLVDLAYSAADAVHADIGDQPDRHQNHELHDYRKRQPRIDFLTAHDSYYPLR